MGFGHHNAPLFKAAPPVFEGKGHIGQRLFGMRPQMRGQRGGVRIQRGFAAPGNTQRHGTASRFLRTRGACGCFFDDRMGIGAAHAQRS